MLKASEYKAAMRLKSAVEFPAQRASGSQQRIVGRLCVICGARVRNQNPKTTTCDPTCTRAKHAGRTRKEQIEHEMAVDEYNDCCAGHAHLWQDTDEIRVKRKARI